MQHMKTMQKCLIVLLAGAMAAVSCNKQPETKSYTITSDITSVSEVAANNPGTQTLVVTTDAPYWIAMGPEWVSIDPVMGVGGGKSTVVTLTFQSNYKNESTDTFPRTGEVKFSGGMTSLVVPVSQLGHKGIIDPDASIGGIPDEDEFMDFIAAVNDGEPIIRWLNDKQEVELLEDLDLSGVEEWVPIGNVEKTGNGNNASAPEGNYFSGVFNGGGHTIKGFKVSKTDIADGGTFGFFGALYRATVKDLNIEADFTVGGLATGDAGVLAGTVYASTIENVKVTGTIKTEGTQTDNKRFAVGGIAGFVFCCSSEGDLLESSIKGCEVNVTVTGNGGANTKNGATAPMFGGIAGFSTGDKSAARTTIENCVARGTINADQGRCSGILATANNATVIKDCTNYMSQVNNFANGRVGNLVSLLNLDCHMVNCANYGDVTTTSSTTTTAGMIALLNDNSCTVEGGGNYGNIRTANTTATGRGLLVANFSKFASFKNVVVSGTLGMAGGEVFDVNAGNFMEYIGGNSAGKETISGLTYVAPAQ